MYDIVIDTNILFSALYSINGASNKLLNLINSNLYKIHLSVPLFIEYETILKNKKNLIEKTNSEIDDFLDYIFSKSKCHEIFYLWRPFLKDYYDDMLLEVAVSACAEYIITFNRKDFLNVTEQFGIKVIEPGNFYNMIIRSES